MIEFIIMVLVATILLLFVVTPALLAFFFDYSPSKYIESVRAGIYFWGAIIALCIFTLAIGLTINFIGGDPQPITTLIERIIQK